MRQRKSNEVKGRIKEKKVNKTTIKGWAAFATIYSHLECCTHFHIRKNESEGFWKVQRMPHSARWGINSLVEAYWWGQKPNYRGSVRLWIDSALLWIKWNGSDSASTRWDIEVLTRNTSKWAEPTNKHKRQSQYSSTIFSEYKKKKKGETEQEKK